MAEAISPPLFVLAGLTFLGVRRDCGSRMLASLVPREAAPRALPFLSSRLLPALEGSPGINPWSVIVRHRHFSALALAGRRGELPLPPSNGRERCSLPYPPSNRQRALPASSTDCSRRLHVRFVIVELQFSDARLPGARGGGTESFALPLPPSLAGSRWVGVSRLFLVPMGTALPAFPSL